MPETQEITNTLPEDVFADVPRAAVTIPEDVFSDVPRAEVTLPEDVFADVPRRGGKAQFVPAGSDRLALALEKPALETTRQLGSTAILNKPILEATPTGGKFFGYGGNDPEKVAEVQRIQQEGTPLEKQMLGLRQGADEFLSGLTSPLSLGTFGVAGILKGTGLSRALSAWFALHTGKNLAVDTAQALGAEYGKPEDQRDPAKLAKLWTSAALSAPLTAALGTHALRGEAAPLTTPRGPTREEHLSTLGLDPDATPADIKSAFRDLAKQFHPDVAGNTPEATAKFQEILDAYTALTPPKPQGTPEAPKAAEVKVAEENNLPATAEVLKEVSGDDSGKQGKEKGRTEDVLSPTTGVAETKTAAPVPEKLDAIHKQLEVTLDPASTKAVTLITPGSPLPMLIPGLHDVPPTLSAVDTKHGLAIFNPAKTTREAVLAAAEGKDFDGTLLGMSQSTKPEPVGNTVVQTTKNGVPVLDEVVPPTAEAIAKAAEAHKAAVPGGETKVVPAEKVLEERTANVQPIEPNAPKTPTLAAAETPAPVGTLPAPTGDVAGQPAPVAGEVGVAEVPKASPIVDGQSTKTPGTQQESGIKYATVIRETGRGHTNVQAFDKDGNLLAELNDPSKPQDIHGAVTKQFPNARAVNTEPLPIPRQDRFTPETFATAQKSASKHHPVVERALAETVPQIGQLKSGELAALNKAVKNGVLVKGKGGPYPTEKTVYAKPGYDFAGERAKAIAEITKRPKQPTVEATNAEAKMQEQVSEVAKTEGTRPAKEIKSELIEKLESALKKAPTHDEWLEQSRNKAFKPGMKQGQWATSEGSIKIHIPGDGTFTVRNHKAAIEQVLKDARRLSTTAGESGIAKAPRIGDVMTYRGRLDKVKDDAKKIYGERPAVEKLRAQAADTELVMDEGQRKNLNDAADELEAALPENVAREGVRVLNDKITDLRESLDIAREALPKEYEKTLDLQAALDERQKAKKPTTKAMREFIDAKRTWEQTGRDIKAKEAKLSELEKQLAEQQAVLAKLEEQFPKPEAKLTEESTNEDEELSQTATKGDPFERARGGDEAAFDELDAQFREIYPEDEPTELERGPNRDQVHTPEAFRKLFEKAFAARDFDSILNAIKATSDVTVWKPYMKEMFAQQAKGDAIAAKKVDWLRHVFNGTRPADAVPPKQPKATPAGTSTPPAKTPTGGTKPGATPPPPGPPPSPPPVRIPVDPISGGGAKSPYKIIEDFSAAIGKAIRVRRLKMNTLGTYAPGSTLTTERFAGDLDTAAHELAGHWTDDRYGIGKPWIKPRTRSPYDTELAKFWIHGSVTPTSTLRYRRAEGVAEFIRAYVVNPTMAKAEAPTFAAYFEKTLPPEALKAIQDFGTDVRTWAGEDPLVRAGLNIRMEPPTLTERLWRGLTGRGFGFEINPVDRLRLWFDDPYHYAVKAFHQAQELRGGLPIKPEQNFELLSRLLATHDARMSDQFEHGLVPLRPDQVPNAKGELETKRLIDPVTNEPMTMKWLLGAFDTKDKATMQQEMRDASAFMVAQRTLEKGAQIGRTMNVSGIGAGIMSDKQAAQELLNRVASEPARETRLKEAARRYRLWADQNIQMLVDAGRLSTEQAQDIRDKNEFYVDMHRLSDEFDVQNRAQRGSSIGTMRDVMKRFKGSTLELDNVYSNLLEQTDSIQREAHRNVTLRTFTDSLSQVRSLHGANLIDFDQFGSRAKAEDKNTIRVFKDGKADYWKFDPAIYESLKGLGELGTHAFVDILAIPSRLARYMITHGPQFIARNVVRDTVERSVNSRNASRPWDILQGYSQAELSRYEVFGGGQFGNYIVDAHVWNRELKRVVRQLTKDPTNIILAPLKLKTAWDHLSEMSEKLGRIAEFRRAFERGKKELGYDDYNAALYAAGEARGLLDFAKAGTVMRVINRLVPFSNARVRGLARATVTMKENPAGFAMRWGLFVLLPTLAMMLWNRRDKATWDEYLQQPAYLRDFFWNFKMGPYWVRIPKPHELGVMAGGAERGILRMEGDKRAMEGYGGSSANAALPIGDPVELAGPIRSLLEVKFNRDTFRNRDIIPNWERDLKLELRKGTNNASATGKGIAGVINAAGLEADPRQVDYLLNSYGGIGQIATSIGRSQRGPLDTALKSTGYVVEPPGTAARDVQWVFDWARKNGKTSDPAIETLHKMSRRILNEKDVNERDRLSRELRDRATRLRDLHDK